MHGASRWQGHVHSVQGLRVWWDKQPLVPQVRVHIVPSAVGVRVQPPLLGQDRQPPVPQVQVRRHSLVLPL